MWASCSENAMHDSPRLSGRSSEIWARYMLVKTAKHSVNSKRFVTYPSPR